MQGYSADRVRAFAPATIANLSVGFDILGLAIRQPGDTVNARVVEGDEVRIAKISGDEGKLPGEATRNTAGIAARAILEKVGLRIGIELELEKGLPIGSGLGSSAASAAAAAVAVNRIIGTPLRRKDLIGPCLQAEEEVSGKHADNVAACLLGGLVMVRSVEPLDIIRLPVPENLHVAVITPAIEIKTETARAILPKTVGLSEMVDASANLAAFVSACHSGDLSLMARCKPDPVITAARADLIPGCMSVIETAHDRGALLCSISGAGPALFALCHSESTALAVGQAMQNRFREADLDSTVVISPADCPGAREL